jgi:alkylation response protein AidB-like acyl-CoA dehydrogenase
MDFAIAPNIQDILARVRAFVDNELLPMEAEFLQGEFRDVEPHLRQKRDQVKALGLWLPQIAADHGGLGLTLLEHGLVSAELGRSPLGHYCFNCQAPDSGNMEILLQYGTPEQQAQWLKPLMAGDIRSCFSMTEPDFPGSNPVWMGTTAVKDGGDYVINGKKWFTTAADGAAFAIVMAVTNPDQEPHFRASQIIVPAGTPGFEVTARTPCMGHRGDGWATHCEISYTDCRVPQANLLGPEGAGFMIAQERLGPGRIHHCMRWIGICERAWEIMVDHAAKREIAPGVPLASRQFVQGWIAESRAEIDAARLAVLHAAWTIDQQGAKAARDAISLIKFNTAGTLMRVLDRSIQALGALGITDYTPLALWFRNERASRIYDGADEVHKVSYAKRLLKRRAGR